jgi:hypothetical protein
MPGVLREHRLPLAKCWNPTDAKVHGISSIFLSSCAAEVTDPYRQDFVEASTVLPFSSKASAALSRRCLQPILKDKAGVDDKDLFDQFEEIAGSGKVPSHIAADLHV